ncbi:rhamnogalacturonan acetylesterase [Sphingobium sp. CR2-8]|uniref:rhamnogalacturonan acetylesterase n=1 Tax=Sphingobium sp. CR2-8 TaxID=1306534 RepID=UPI002DBE7DA0|nr:rhamnogalacturonan acetylesterase [Sphingobium sp. CR2-8]MEC3912733.1 rhamnogalacturonan acetylesterase [Sphingobium sp. CR2-8]
MRTALAIVAVFAALFATQVAQATRPGDTILIASDSTAATYKADRYPQVGWGQMLSCGLAPDVRVSNHAMGGRSTRTFLAEGRWARLMAEVMPGDTVLIQFGHNDQARNKLERWAPAATDYRDNLMRFIWDVRTAGGVPVLVTPVARRNFGVHGKAVADYPAYSGVMRTLATDLHVPLIDLEARSRVWLDRAGPEAAKAYYLHYRVEDHVAAFPKGVTDDTHFSEIGGRQVADLVADGLKALNLPVSAKVLSQRPALTRTTPLGRTDCQ